MEAKFVTKDDFQAFLDNFKKEMDEWKGTNNENIKKYNEIKKNQEKNDVIANKLVDKIVKVNLFKSKSDDNISKKSQNKELKNVIEEDKDKKPKSCEKKKKEKKKKNKKEIENIEKLSYIEIQN